MLHGEVVCILVPLKRSINLTKYGIDQYLKNKNPSIHFILSYFMYVLSVKVNQLPAKSMAENNRNKYTKQNPVRIGKTS